MNLYSVYDLSGKHFRQVSDDEALVLIEQQAAVIDGKRRKIRLRLTCDQSAARVILAPRYQLSQGSRTTIIEYLGERETPLYQHHERRCLQWLETCST